MSTNTTKQRKTEMILD